MTSLRPKATKATDELTTELADIVNLVWACGRTRNHRVSEVHGVHEQLLLMLRSSHDLKPRDLANLAWSSTRLHASIPALNALARSICQSEEFRPKELASIAWAWGKLMKKNMTLMDVLASQTLAAFSHPMRHEFGSKELVSLAWSFARFALYHEVLIDAICHRFPHVQSTSRDLASMAWSLARLRCRDEPLFAMISEESQRKLKQRPEDATPLDLANLA